MILVRSSLYFLMMLLSILLFGTLLSVIGWVLPFAGRMAIANSWGWLNLQLMRWICGLHYRVSGREHLPDGPAIFLSKHQSTWETIAFRWILPYNQTWVLKRELMWLPIFGWSLAAAYSIPIDRKAGRKAARQVVEQGIDRLQRGWSVIIFPEGTRVAPGSRKKYGVGGALLAQRSGYPVVPVAHNAGVFWRRRGLAKYPGTIEVVIGPPIDPAGLTAAEINRRVEAWIEERSAALPQDHERLD